MLIRFFHLIPVTIEQFLLFAFIVIIVGSIAFLGGELLPRKNFDFTAFPFRPYRWEKEGRIYEKIGIRKWKDHVPDMSKYVKTMFAKSIVSPRDPEYTRRLILETCVAELTHEVLMLISPIFTQYMTGLYGEIAMLIYAAGNLPFILIQRYNRPRLIQLMEKQLDALNRNQKKKETESPCRSY